MHGGGRLARVRRFQFLPASSFQPRPSAVAYDAARRHPWRRPHSSSGRPRLGAAAAEEERREEQQQRERERVIAARRAERQAAGAAGKVAGSSPRVPGISRCSGINNRTQQKVGREAALSSAVGVISGYPIHRRRTDCQLLHTLAVLSTSMTRTSSTLCLCRSCGRAEPGPISAFGSCAPRAPSTHAPRIPAFNQQVSPRILDGVGGHITKVSAESGARVDPNGKRCCRYTPLSGLPLCRDTTSVGIGTAPCSFNRHETVVKQTKAVKEPMRPTDGFVEVETRINRLQLSC